MYDVVISGGGMAGASLAWALTRLPIRIALVEPVAFESAAQPSFDDRTIALSRSSQRILDSLGLWSEIGGQACPIREIHVSERGRLGNAVINGEEQGVGDLGYVVANRVLGAALWQRLRVAKNVAVFCPGRITAVRQQPERLVVDLVSEQHEGPLGARLLAVAEGAGSALRQALGIGVAHRPYDQTAIVGSVEVAAGGNGHAAYERFTAEGPIALLPGGGRRFIFVMARAARAAPAIMALDDAAFLDLLQRGFGQRLGRFSRVGRRNAYPLTLVQARRVIAPRAALIGNAAHGLHPVAGQGYNLGLRDVAALAELVADAIRAGADPGSAAVLEQYAAWRRRDQRNVVAFTDGLIRLFELPLRTLGIARGLGLMLFDVLPGAKSSLAHYTMGLGGTLTRLARGLPL
jgi:2-octaprenyl-6-methoxyphenol hydroxylase